MKKEIKLQLEVKKVSISKLNNIFGAGADPLTSIDLPCVVTTVEKTIIGDDCKTGDTKTNRSLGNCIVVDSKDC